MNGILSRRADLSLFYTIAGVLLLPSVATATGMIRLEFDDSPPLGSQQTVSMTYENEPVHAGIFVRHGAAPSGCSKAYECIGEFSDDFIDLQDPYSLEYNVSPAYDGHTISFFAVGIDSDNKYMVSNIAEINFGHQEIVVENPGLVVYPVTTHSGYVQNADGVNVYGSPSNPASYPHVWAIENANSGNFNNVVRLTAGNYAAFEWDQDSNNSSEVGNTHASEDSPIVIVGDLSQSGERLAVIKRRSGSGEITMAVFPKNQNHTFSYIHWHNILLEVSSRTGIHFNSANNTVAGTIVRGWTFDNVELDGGFNHKTQIDTKLPGGSDLNSKWAIMTWGVADFRFLNGYIHSVRREHGLYIHNSVGDVEIRNNLICEVGRTAVQITAREDESSAGGPDNMPANYGDITIEDNTFADTGLSRLDNYNGGKMITITGRNFGVNSVRNNTLEMGYDTCTPGLQAGLSSQPDYTNNTERPGVFVSWTTWKENLEGLGPLYIENNFARISPAIHKHTEVFKVSAAEMAMVRNNTVSSSQTSAAGKPFVLGSNYDTQGHPVPDTYCVRDNTLNDVLNANFLISNGSGGWINNSQPESLGMACEPMGS